MMNCASYLFKGVSLKAETVSTTEDTKGMEGQIDASSEGGISFLSNLAKLSGGLSLQGNKNNIQSYQNTMERTITLGSLHMDVINALDEEDLKYVGDDFLKIKPSTHDYVKVKAVLKPVDIYSVLEVLKLVLPQLENFFALAGEFLFKAESSGKNKNKILIQKKVEKAIGTAKAISDLIGEIERDYQSSNQLEMIMVDDKERILGVLDIDIQNKSLNEVKAQLTDGEFFIFGKVIRYISKDSELNLAQRSLLSALNDKLNKVMKVISMFQTEGQDVLEHWKGITELVQMGLNEILTLKIKGPVIRVKAMSICM